MATIPASHADLLTPEKRAFAHLATVNAAGSPQVTPIWFDYDGTHVIINSAAGRVKDRNLRRDPRVALSILDQEQPYRYVQIQGRVVDVSEEGARDVINTLAKKYLGQDTYPGPEGETRVTYKIAPEKVQTMG
ncbi:MAG: PPOX class F420-dependent oxidoreductase [Armatimonadetes bacterium]|nr:PPOX class F420-dependent oxidoreductase [Armatimonadota bacterium]